MSAPATRKTPRRRARPASAASATPASTNGFDTVALVLQGGGALGSYQAGVAEGLMAAGIEPDWVAGISIGALNSAIVAGNAPEQRLEKLRGFWETICQPVLPFDPVGLMRPWLGTLDNTTQRAFSGFEAWRSLVEGRKGFFTPRGVMPWIGLLQPTAEASFYSTAQLKSTLERFADFDRINHGPMRVSVGAVDVQNGDFVFFDNQRGDGDSSLHVKLRPEHFMASGALPPGFPAVEIEGRFYWDGGLVSNTPLWQVLGDQPRRNTLVFQVDLWSATGPLPQNVYDAEERMKDIQYSSRTRAVTDSMKRQQQNRRMLAELLDLIPPKARAASPWAQRAAAQITSAQYAVIHLIYRDKAWESQNKDYEFGRATMLEHWSSGLTDVQGALAHPEWLKPAADGSAFVTHDDVG